MSSSILVIEDDPASLELMTYLLESHGLTPLGACRGDTGLALVQEKCPDLVVCDIQLPGMDGYAIARTVKADERLRHVRLMAVTALAMVGDREKVIEAGFDSYATKPIDPQTFMAQIESLLGRPQSRSVPQPQATEAPVDASSHRRRATLLVVDDSLLNQELKRSIFEPYGYSVITATTVAAGLSCAFEQQPAAIITDIGLPDGSGLDMLRQLKADSRTRDIPVVVITSTHTDPATGSASMSLGAARFLVRPMDAAQVLSEIESVLLHRR